MYTGHTYPRQIASLFAQSGRSAPAGYGVTGLAISAATNALGEGGGMTG